MPFDLDHPQMERVGCSFCGAPAAQSIDVGAIAWKGERLSYRVCARCGLKYMDWRPTEAWYAFFYANEFWQSKTTEADPRAVAQHRDWQTRRVRRIEKILTRAFDPATMKRVLEIGASWGETLNALRARYGWQVAAVEPSRLAQQNLREHFAIELAASVIEGLPERADLRGSFDLVLISHVLENTLDPLRSLRIIADMLKPGGHLFIDTPNIYYNDLENPYHPFIFFPETLINMLAATGFRTLLVDKADNPRPGVGGMRPMVDPRKTAYLGIVAVRSEEKIEARPVDPAIMVAAQANGRAAYRRAANLGRRMGAKPWRYLRPAAWVAERMRPLA